MFCAWWWIWWMNKQYQRLRWQYQTYIYIYHKSWRSVFPYHGHICSAIIGLSKKLHTCGRFFILGGPTRGVGRIQRTWSSLPSHCIAHFGGCSYRFSWSSQLSVRLIQKRDRLPDQETNVSWATCCSSLGTISEKIGFGQEDMTTQITQTVAIPISFYQLPIRTKRSFWRHDWNYLCESRSHEMSCNQM